MTVQKALVMMATDVATAVDFSEDSFVPLRSRDWLEQTLLSTLSRPTNGILATRLRDLVRRGIFEIVPASDGTAYKEYALTDKGRCLFNVVVGLRQWGANFYAN